MEGHAAGEPTAEQTIPNVAELMLKFQEEREKNQRLDDLLAQFIRQQRNEGRPQGNEESPHDSEDHPPTNGAQQHAPPPTPPIEVRNATANYSSKAFMKFHPPKFYGNIDSKVTENWIRTMERLCDLARVPQEDKVRLAIYLLREDASYWWDTMAAIHGVDTMTWEHFRNLLEERYLTTALKDEKAREFTYLRQKKMLMEEFIRKFNELSRYAPHMVFNTIHPDIRKDLEVADLEGASFSKVADKALKIERAILMQEREKEDEFRRQGARNFRNRQNNHFMKGGPSQKSSDKKRPNQWSFNNNNNNNKRGKEHSQEKPGFPQCPKCNRYHPGECRVGTNTCYICGKSGHFARECSNRNDQYKGGEEKKTNARVFALTREEAEASPSIVISGQLLFNNIPASVLVNS
ncbi:uncharacterized protein LOC133779373 [Humulus lupulus]|uniref:uncharacterized protein LOC133779373 n=1 Tax=Humulus lupulus TaxID=3486 RepID=UPI002B40A3C9|nr:uncharacterized protein LOC133779373 [Humulus lupulus]